MTVVLDKSLPYVPADCEAKHAHAFKHLAAGKATEHEQKMALDYVIHELCKTYDLSYRPTSDRDTAFAEGKRFVGLQIVKLLNLTPEQIRRLPNVGTAEPESIGSEPASPKPRKRKRTTTKSTSGTTKGKRTAK